MRMIFGAAAVAALMAGCASGVRLDDVPVEDKSVIMLHSSAPANAAGPVASNGVAPVALGRADTNAAIPSAARVVYFDYDSFVIKPEFQSVVESNARYLTADRKRKVVIEGHTDERGGREYNLALGQKRSEAVRQALSLLGVEDAQAEAVSFGKEKPVALGSDEAAMAKNRRAELMFR